MARRSTREKLSQEINAGSMADIAFLLLIFFLVTTTIAEDKGVLVKLPPWVEEEQPEQIIKERNVLTVLINAQNQLLVEGEEMDINDLREAVKLFIKNPDNDPNKAEKPTKAIVSLQNDRGTKYEIYLQVYNELKAAYRELWEEEAMRLFGKPYDALNKDQQRKVRNNFPLVISEADPTEFGEE